MEFLIPIALLFVLMWVVVARPQRRRQLAQLTMQDRLAVGDEVITAGGIHGTVRAVEDDVLSLEIAPGTEVRIDRRAISAVVEEESPDAPENQAESG
jgi:preprotein translocase subunit YajC